MRHPGYPMRLAAKRTGLTAHVIRAWERRYAAVTPTRTETNRRLYSDEDVERLSLLRLATAAGHSISQIARLPAEELRGLVASPPGRADPATSGHPKSATPQDYWDEGVRAVVELDGEALESSLLRASVALGLPILIEELIAPLLREIGHLWQRGKIRAANEHLASAVIRTLLANLKDSYRVGERAPRLVVTTPAAQMHELGALIATVTAASDGWRTIYLGPNLPAHEIAGVANQHRVRAVALSIVYPPDDPHLGNELRQLRRCLAADTALLAGGRAAGEYASELGAVGAQLTNDTVSLRAALETIRREATPSGH